MSLPAIVYVFAGSITVPRISVPPLRGVIVYPLFVQETSGVRHVAAERTS
jgi:hypothetical protein